MSAIDLQARREEQRRRALAAADERMQLAKRRFSLASLACLRAAPDAAEQVAKALAEVDQARAALREIGDA